MKNSKFQKDMLEIEEFLKRSAMINNSKISGPVIICNTKMYKLISNCISNVIKHPELEELYYSDPNAYFHPNWKYAKPIYKRYNPTWTNEIYENIDDDETVYIGRK